MTITSENKMSLDQIRHQEVIPEINSVVFAGHESSHLALGIVAIGNDIVPGLEEEYRGYSLLRGNVYAKEKMYMPLDELNPDGTESDPDDARSVHFAVIENAILSERVVGAMRLIIKSREHDEPLPIEEHYPEAFNGEPMPILTTEVSRLISRHENPKVQNKVKWLLFAAGVTYIKENDLGPILGAVESGLARGLASSGVPVEPLAKPKFIEEFNATKLPIRVDIGGLARTLEGDRPNLLTALQTSKDSFVYDGTVREPLDDIAPVA